MIEVRGLSFCYRGGETEVLRDLRLEVGGSSRCLVIGANGAGKTTLLRVLAGKHMVAEETVRVLGRSAFHDTSLAADVEYLGGTFPFDVDVEVRELLERRREAEPARRERLVELLGVDLGWRMHAVSDGQRRRVQLLLGLLEPSALLLLDEVTTDLDLLARQDLLAFLREESEERGVTILYATHILDRLDTWATHILYMSRGQVALNRPLHEIGELEELRAAGSPAPLVDLALRWLSRDVRGGR